MPRIKLTKADYERGYKRFCITMTIKEYEIATGAAGAIPLAPFVKQKALEQIQREKAMHPVKTSLPGQSDLFHGVDTTGFSPKRLKDLLLKEDEESIKKKGGSAHYTGNPEGGKCRK